MQLGKTPGNQKEAIQESQTLMNLQKLGQVVQMMVHQGPVVKRRTSRNQEVKEVVDVASERGLVMKTSEPELRDTKAILRNT